MSQPIYLDMGNVSLEELLAALEEQYGVDFAYSPSLLPLDTQVSTQYQGQPLALILDELFGSLHITYQLKGNRIILTKPAKEKQVERTVSGQVYAEEDNVPLIGVTVAVKGTGKGTVTDEEGRYRLAISSEDAVLVFSYMGKLPQQVPVKARKEINVQLRDDLVQLQSVVVTGYGTQQRKEDLVGSVEFVTAEKLKYRPADRVDQLLEGVVPGLRFEVQSDDASSARPRYQTRIRGAASFSASNEPLWIVDGVPVYTGGSTNLIPGVSASVSPLSYLNPSDIESVTVLKDAAATSIYGANGANGVVLITTKRGKSGEDRLSVRVRKGINHISDTKFQVLSGDEFRELAREAYANSGLDPAAYPYGGEVDTVNTSWYDAFFRTGQTSDYNLSLTGGNERTKYFISSGYYKEDKTMLANSTQRLSTRINLDQRIGKRLNLNFRMGGSYNKNKLFTPGDYYYTTRPNINPYQANGDFALRDAVTGNKLFNKLAEAAQNDHNQHTFAVNGNMGAVLVIAEGLDFTSRNGIDFYSIREDQYASRKNWSGRDLEGNPMGYADRAQTTFLKWISINRLNYSKSFGKHQVDALLGTEASDGQRTSLSGSGYNFANDQIKEITYTPYETQRANSSAEEESALSMFSNLTYNWDRRYYVTVNFRRDGNSRFGNDVRWANFASAGASWNLHHEPFWKSKTVNFLKLKASYGTNGNSRIGNYAAKGLYSFGANYAYDNSPGAVISTGENPDFSWETTYMLNTGVRIGFWDRIYLEGEVYSNVTENLIDKVDVTRASGQTRIYRNVGKVRNAGVEFTLSTVNINYRDLQWTTDVNLAHNRNKILALYNGNDKSFGTSIRQVGRDASTLYLVRWAGVDPRDGAPLWYDAAGNLTRVYDVNNRVPVGSANPDFFGGITNRVSYKNFSLSVLLNYTVGGYAFSSLRRNAESDGLYYMDDNQSKNQLDRWQRPGDMATTPKLIWGVSQSSMRNSTRFVHEKTNLRLQNISLAYSLPSDLAGKFFMQQASAFVQLDNAGFWTPYKNRSDRNTYKNSFSPYPVERVISVGINLGI
ncbi:SusC/RagA family TonB-linked outer membrane protein [Pontibacter mangrovi]|uniref:SusC/RagA family TonB-linked outer membrane protein n=1 Tax=Pontibacter mangrovi TaxID=2589816 RepID=UPI0015E356A2|nr:SusC/RagA family TonB-linked outer membrane protein [Pontibacter mangrovi]